MLRLGLFQSETEILKRNVLRSIFTFTKLVMTIMRDEATASEWISNYKNGMLAHDKLNPPTILGQASRARDEAKELCGAVMEMNVQHILEETSDTIHALLRVVVVAISTHFPVMTEWVVYLPVVAVPTAKKHADRYMRTGCVQSGTQCKLIDHSPLETKG